MLLKITSTMKKNIYLLLILFVSCNLIAQNPFVKKIEFEGDVDIKKIIKENKFYYGTSNVRQPDWYFESNDFVLELYHNFNNLTREWIDAGKIHTTALNFEFTNTGSFLIFDNEKKYIFKNFTFFYNLNTIYLRGYDNDKYIEFYTSINDYKGINRPLPITRYFLINNFDYVSYIKNYVQNKFNDWKQKGDFEKLADYNFRMTEEKINKTIQQYHQEAMSEIKNYFWKFIGKNSKFDYKSYDSENEIFIVNSELFGDLAIKVPIENAPIFKEKFKYSFSISELVKNPQFILSNNELILSRLDFEIDTNTCWTYNINEELKYTNTVIEYNFDKIDINVPQTSINKSVTEIENKNISVGKSSVDVNIPENTKVLNRYALIIGNEDYQSMQRTLNSEQNVAFAVNDATVFRDYAVKTLGLEQENITFLTNATAGQMSQQIDKVCKMLSKLGNKAELIVYYAGHGYPDENTKVPYLIPVDVSASNLDMGIKLNDLYKNLAATNAKRIVVFLDACFTGGGRSSGILASRGIKVIPKEDALNGNIVVVSASSGLQSALPYQNEKHGMFSYYLLKKMQDSKGNITLGNLFSYIRENVSLQSLKINNKEQDPTINFSAIIEKEYENWNFKN